MPIEKVNNVFEPFKKYNCKTASKPAFYTSVKENTKGDTFYSKHKKTIITAGIIASVIGLGFAAKKGLLGEKIKNLIEQTFMDKKTKKMIDKFNNPFHKDKAPSAALSDIYTLHPDIRPRQYVQTPVCLDNSSIEGDLSAWASKMKSENLSFRDSRNLKLLENLKPHNYSNTSDIFLVQRSRNIDFQNFAITNDGKLSVANLDVCQFAERMFGIPLDYRYGYTAGLDAEKKACVLIHFMDGRQDKVGRQIHPAILLRAKDSKFTQEQLDLINMFEHLSKDEIKNNPLGLAFLETFKKSASTDDTGIYFNKNTFYSIIKCYADKCSGFFSDVVSGNTAKKFFDMSRE